MQVTIQVGDLNCRILGEDKKKAISKARGYFKMGQDSYAKKHNKHIPDYIYMVTNKGRFKTGLLEYMIDYLESEGFQVRTINKKNVQELVTESQIESGLDYVPYTLRPYQREALEEGLSRWNGIFHMATGAGKAQPLDSTVYTPDGPVEMGDVEPGDYVMTPDGNKTLVVDTFPQGDKDVYKVIFDDGSEVECTENHLWETSSRSERFRRMNVDGERHKISRSSVKTLLEIKNSLYTGKNGYKNHSVKVSKPVQFEENDFVISPYVMGALLGDGSFRHNVRFSSCDDFILEKVERELQSSFGEEVELSDKGNNDYNIIDNKKHLENRVKDSLENLLLLNLYSSEKFIPEKYLYSSIRDRVELLQGLMDTDGTCSDGSKSPSFTTTSKQLADNVQELVESLGGKVTRGSRVPKYDQGNKTGKKSFRLRLKLPNYIDCFSLPRKKCEVVKTKNYKPIRYIDDVEYVGRKKCKCIKVLDQDSLYLTENFVPTHNTVVLASLISIFWQDKTLILIDSVDLAKQLREEVSEIIDEKVGLIGNGVYDERRVTVGIDKTLLANRCGKRKKKKIDNYLESVSYLIYDECHHLGSPTWRKISRRCKNASIRHGFSATPITANYKTARGNKDNKNLYLYGYAGPVIYEKRLSDLVDRGWLAEPKINIVRHDLYWDGNPYDVYTEEYERIIVQDEERNDKIAKIAKKHYREDEQVVGFVDRLEHGKRIEKKLINEYNLGNRAVEFVNGQDPNKWRENKINEFKNGELPILIGTVLQEGLNFFCDAGINIAGNKFEKTVYQRMGRCLRKSSTNPETGDIDPTVYESIDWYDFSDSNHEWFERQANQRAEAYLKEDLDVSIIKEGEL